MKIKINNPNKIVCSAFFKEAKSKDSFSVFINTYKKRVWFDSVMSGNFEIVWYYHVEDDNELECRPEGCDTVRLIAETQEENLILERFRFMLMEKDQLWILFPKDSVWEMEV